MVSKTVFLYQIKQDLNINFSYISDFLSENFFRRTLQKFCIELDWRVMLVFVTLIRVKLSHCYLDRQQLYEIATFDEIFMTKTFSTIDSIIKSNFEYAI